MNAHQRTHAPADVHIPGELLELKSLLELDWPARQAAIAASGVPVNEETDEERQQREERERVAAEEARNEKKLSQAEVDRIVADRLARDRKDRPSDDELAQLREKAKKLDDAEAANLSELERERAARETAERERDEARAASKEAKLTNSILAEASKADRKIVDPDAVLSLLDRSTLTLDDNGVPTNIADAMDTLLEKRPYLVAAEGGGTTARGGSADQGARGGNKQVSATDDMSSSQIVEALGKGDLDEYLATPNA